MSADHRLSNTTSRPVQLHLAGDVTVVPAFGVITCPEEALADRQVQVLRRKGVLAVLPPAPAQSLVEPAEPTRRTRRTRRTSPASEGGKNA